MADLQHINAEFFKPYLTILHYFRCTGIDIFDERNVLLYKFKYAPIIIFLCFIIISCNHWRYVIQKLYSGTDLLDLAVDLSFSYNSIECFVLYLHLVLIKGKIKSYVLKLQTLWRNDDDLSRKVILLKRDQVKQIDLYNYIYCKSLQVFIHCYLGIPLIIILVKKFLLKRDVSYVTPLKFTLPFDYQNNIVTFLVVYLFDYTIVCMMAYTVNGSLFFLSVTMNQLRTMFVLHQEDFKEIIKAKDADVDVKLRHTIQKHSMLSNMFGQLGDAYSAIFVIHVFFLTINVCFYGIAARINVRLEDFKNFLISVISVTNMYYCCMQGQLVTDSALDVATAIYDSPWEELSSKNRKIILLSILRSQRATYIRSTSFTEISLKTFQMLMKTTWSFVSLLAKLYEN